jgi:hypothetical protein
VSEELFGKHKFLGACITSALTLGHGRVSMGSETAATI